MEHRIVITVPGMGDYTNGDTVAWARGLFEGDAVPIASAHGAVSSYQADGLYWHIVEAIMEPVHQAFRTKMGASLVLPSSVPAAVSSAVMTRVSDVLSVLKPAVHMKLNQSFEKALRTACALAADVAGRGASSMDVPMGVLSHSLGTLLAYEGLWYCTEVRPLENPPYQLGVALCAPMLGLYRAVGTTLPVAKHLRTVDKPLQRPAMSPSGRILVRTLDLYFNKNDPFYVTFDKTRQHYPKDFDDEVTEFSAPAPTMSFWEAHGMEQYYVRRQRSYLLATLFPGTQR